VKTCYALDKLDKSIFLAGPTPRSPSVASWRPEALRILTELSFEGTVLVPEQASWQPHDHYDDQIRWEWEALNKATVIAFWVPRELESMPAFTTNVEFGLLASSSRVLLGYPLDAPKMRYLSELAKRYNVGVSHSLRELLAAAVDKAKRPF
jgi:hypothetical protein